MPEAGWYPDPKPGEEGERFWDGEAWTPQVRPAVEPAVEAVEAAEEAAEEATEVASQEATIEMATPEPEPTAATWFPPPAPPPPAAPAAPAPTAPTVVVPAWVVNEWGPATVLALKSLAVFAVVGLVTVLATLLMLMLRFGLDGLSWGEMLVSVPAIPMLYLGGVDRSPVLLTGIVLLALAMRFLLRGAPMADRTPVMILTMALKTALVFVAVLIAITVALDVTDLRPAAGPGATAMTLHELTDSPNDFDYVRLFFVSGTVVFLVAVFAIARATGTTALTMLGLPHTAVPRAVSSSWVGVLATLRVAGIGLLALWTVGSILDHLSNDDTGNLADFAGVVIAIVFLSALLLAVDIAASFLVGTMAFFENGLVFFFDPPGWAWVGVAITAAAFFHGGRRAAEHHRAATMAQALQGAGLIGVLLGLLGVLLAIDYEGLGGHDGYAPEAFLLPLLWTLPALVGAWWYATNRGLPTGIVVADTSPASVPNPADPTIPAPVDPTVPDA